MPRGTNFTKVPNKGPFGWLHSKLQLEQAKGDADSGSALAS
jgi:hypothetical protein